MSINIYSLLYLLIGLGLGLFYFGGLWLTIKNMNQSRSPIVLTLGSFVLRTGTVFLVLIYIGTSKFVRVPLLSPTRNEP